VIFIDLPVFANPKLRISSRPSRVEENMFVEIFKKKSSCVAWLLKKLDVVCGEFD